MEWSKQFAILPFRAGKVARCHHEQVAGNDRIPVMSNACSLQKYLPNVTRLIKCVMRSWHGQMLWPGSILSQDQILFQ
jgi:hypothetical protein